MNHKKMRKKIFNFFEIAAKCAQSKKDQRTFLLGAVGIRNDGVLVKSQNGPSMTPMPKAHAERKLINKLDYGSIVYICRIRVGDGTMAMAFPCRSCLVALLHKKVKRVYYTIGPDHFGTIDLEGKTVRDVEEIFLNSDYSSREYKREHVLFH